MALYIGIKNLIGKGAAWLRSKWTTIVTQLLAEFRYRLAGGSDNSSLPERKGRAILQKVYGKTVKWNQLVDTTTTSVTLVSGNKYYTMINGTASVVTGDGSSVAVTGGTDMVIDLTAAEIDSLTTVEQVEAWLALNVGAQDYYPYTTGELISFTGQGVKSVGFNKWDEQWEMGTYNTSTGAKMTSTNSIINSNPIKVLPSTDYYLKKSTTVIWILYYDSDKRFINCPGVANEGIFTTPSNCYYINIINGYSGGPVTTYNHDICINLSDPAKNGTYEPYWEDGADLSFISTLEDGNGNLLFPDGELRKAGSVQDWVTETGASKGNKEIDLGDLEWQYNPNWGGAGAFYVELANAQPNPNIDAASNIICQRYKSVSRNDLYANEDFSVGLTGTLQKTLTIRDSAHSGSDIDAQGHASFLEGVKLVYALATPIVITHDDEMRYKVDKYSTEEVIVPASADGSPTSTNIVADIEYQSK